MKEIKAIIHPHMVHKVVHALESLEHFPGFTLLEAQGQGRGRGSGGAYVASEEDIGYHRKSILMVVCSGELVERIVETIRTVAHTGHKGDGIITVGELGQVVRIRSGEKNDLAV